VVEGTVQGLLPGDGHLHLEPLVGEWATEGRGQQRIVVDDQDVGTHTFAVLTCRRLAAFAHLLT
jgi:hypothetical protein